LFILGGLGLCLVFIPFFHSWFWMIVPVMLTFFYSAPKLPYKFFGPAEKSGDWKNHLSILCVDVCNYTASDSFERKQ
jgi:hypothetical protein